MSTNQFRPLCGTNLLKGLLVIMALSLSGMVYAGSAKWSTTNVQYLYGTDYNTGLGGDDTKAIITVEHANGWEYGDNFFFLDITNPDRDGTNSGPALYSELSPRFSLSKITGNDLSVGIVKDFLITTTLEAGSGFHNYLYGIAADLDVPGFKFLKFNWYIVRDEATAGNEGSQVTVAWLLPFKVGGLDVSFEGFADYAYDLGAKEDNLITAPRLLVDVGKYFGAPGTLQAGIEYQIWRNQFGVKDQDEDVAQLMVKWIW